MFICSSSLNWTTRASQHAASKLGCSMTQSYQSHPKSLTSTSSSPISKMSCETGLSYFSYFSYFGASLSAAREIWPMNLRTKHRTHLHSHLERCRLPTRAALGPVRFHQKHIHSIYSADPLCQYYQYWNWIRETTTRKARPLRSGKMVQASDTTRHASKPCSSIWSKGQWIVQPSPNAVSIKQFARNVYTLVIILLWKPGPKPEILPELNPSILFGRLQGLTPVHSCTNWSLCLSGSLDEGDCKRWTSPSKPEVQSRL
jgi:hypothetical protein